MNIGAMDYSKLKVCKKTSSYNTQKLLLMLTVECVCMMILKRFHCFFKVLELKTELKKFRLPVYGRKVELIDRLNTFQAQYPALRDCKVIVHRLNPEEVQSMTNKGDDTIQLSVGSAQRLFIEHSFGCDCDGPRQNQY